MKGLSAFSKSAQQDNSQTHLKSESVPVQGGLIQEVAMGIPIANQMLQETQIKKD